MATGERPLGIERGHGGRERLLPARLSVTPANILQLATRWPSRPSYVSMTCSHLYNDNDKNIMRTKSSIFEDCFIFINKANDK